LGYSEGILPRTTWNTPLVMREYHFTMISSLVSMVYPWRLSYDQVYMNLKTVENIIVE